MICPFCSLHMVHVYKEGDYFVCMTHACNNYGKYIGQKEIENAKNYERIGKRVGGSRQEISNDRTRGKTGERKEG